MIRYRSSWGKRRYTTNVKMTREEKDGIRDAARAIGETNSDLIRSAVIDRVNEILYPQEVAQERERT